MEVKDKEEKITIVEKKKNSSGLLIVLTCIIAILVIVFVLPSKEGRIKLSVKSSLDKVVEKSNLETVNFTYNAIAKKCKSKGKCDLKSNNIRDFEYIASCKGTINAGIDFDKIKIDIDKKNKKVIVTLPEATIKDTNVGSLRFLNGEDVPASELPNARKLCEDTIKSKSEKDAKLLPAAKEQARVVLDNFYNQWIKAFNDNYKVEIK